MTTTEILKFLQKDIHSTVFATVDDEGLPQTCVIDLMLADADGLYFLTARGKSFYTRLKKRPFVSLSGMKGSGTLSTTAVTVRGAVRSIGQERLGEIFAQNPYMADIYPTPQSREALEVFHLYRGEGEYFDLSQLPPFRQSFSFGGAAVHEAGYRIDPSRCNGCGMCLTTCPQSCIHGTAPREIDRSHCIHCGNCYRICPQKAVVKLEEGGGAR